jgi:hypothetical protein
MSKESPEIVLKKNQLQAVDCSEFGSAQNGDLAQHKTEISLLLDENHYLNIYFKCFDNLYTEFNNIVENNAPLYNQEVFEIFIAAGNEVPRQYLEIEINPNNAIWVGKITNEYKTNNGISAEMISYSNAKIKHNIVKLKNTWEGQLSIPLSLISEKNSKEYKLNFYRIVAKKEPTETNWVCNEQTCEFLCWSPTLSGTKAAFHIPEKFGSLKIID